MNVQIKKAFFPFLVMAFMLSLPKFVSADTNSFSFLENAIQKSLYAGLRSPRYYEEYEKEEAFFRQLLTHAFQTTTLLSDFSQEPFFLKNKNEISFGIRPFLFTSNQDLYTNKKLGLIATLRKQTAFSFKQVEILAAFNTSFGKEPIYRKRRLSHDHAIDGKEIALALTGGFHKEKIGGALQLCLGGNFSDSKRFVMSGEQKVVFVGLSPILTVTPRPLPVDFFVGGDVVFAKRPSFEEKHEDYYENVYEKQKEILWRVKAGPSYTFQRQTKKRLYQVLLSCSANIENAFEHLFSLSPSLLFQSQNLKKRGSWLFSLDSRFAKQNRDWTFSWGIRL